MEGLGAGLGEGIAATGTATGGGGGEAVAGLEAVEGLPPLAQEQDWEMEPLASWQSNFATLPVGQLASHCRKGGEPGCAVSFSGLMVGICRHADNQVKLGMEVQGTGALPESSPRHMWPPGLPGRPPEPRTASQAGPRHAWCSRIIM